MGDHFSLNDTEPRGSERRWIHREGPGETEGVETEGDLDSWLDVKVDMDQEKLHGVPTKRRVQVYVGGPGKLMDMLRGADRFRTRLLRRDLRWAIGVVEAAGYELAIIRDADEDD